MTQWIRASASLTQAQSKTKQHQEGGQANDNPTGRQESAVSLEWVGPPTAKLGQPIVYQIVVKNTGSCPAQQVIVPEIELFRRA